MLHNAYLLLHKIVLKNLVILYEQTATLLGYKRPKLAHLTKLFKGCF